MKADVDRKLAEKDEELDNLRWDSVNVLNLHPCVTRAPDVPPRLSLQP